MSETPKVTTYPVVGQIIFWWLWLIGLSAGISLLFGAFFLIALKIKDGGLMAGWSLLAVAAEGYLLLQSGRAISRHEKTMSELLWLAVLAGLGVPQVAMVGCGMLSGFMPRMAG